MAGPALAWVVVVTDGAVMRTLHPAGLGAGPAVEIERVVRHHLFGEPDAATAAPAPSPRPLEPAGASLMSQREIATAQGYTGDHCDTCGGFSMKRAGTCLTCQACGATTGCA